MNIVTLSSKGQLVIPKAVRQAAHVSLGDEFLVSYTAGEIRLKPIAPQSSTALDLVAGCLAQPGRIKLDDKELAARIRQRLKSRNAA